MWMIVVKSFDRQAVLFTAGVGGKNHSSIQRRNVPWIGSEGGGAEGARAGHSVRDRRLVERSARLVKYRSVVIGVGDICLANSDCMAKM